VTDGTEVMMSARTACLRRSRSLECLRLPCRRLAVASPLLHAFRSSSSVSSSSCAEINHRHDHRFSAANFAHCAAQFVKFRSAIIRKYSTFHGQLALLCELTTLKSIRNLL